MAHETRHEFARELEVLFAHSGVADGNDELPHSCRHSVNYDGVTAARRVPGGKALRRLHYVLIHFAHSGYGGTAQTSRAQAGGVAMPFIPVLSFPSASAR
jgi:hypothetical protein